MLSLNRCGTSSLGLAVNCVMPAAAACALLDMAAAAEDIFSFAASILLFRAACISARAEITNDRERGAAGQKSAKSKSRRMKLTGSSYHALVGTGSYASPATGTYSHGEGTEVACGYLE